MGLFGSKKTGKNAKENKKENPLNVPKTAQDSIPYQGVYENGIIQINENLFSKMYVIPDINFTIENTDKQKEIFGNFMELLSSFGPEVHIQQVIYNKSIKPAELEKKVLLFQLRQTISLLQKQVFQDLTMKYPKDLNV